MSNTIRDRQMALLWLKIAVVYLVIGVLYGIVLSITQQFHFRGVHAHINLLGWASLALAGLMYHLYPAAARTRLGYAHFALHNGALPIMLVALHFYLGGNAAADRVLAPASLLVGLGILLFAINVMVNMKADGSASVEIDPQSEGAG